MLFQNTRLGLIKSGQCIQGIKLEEIIFSFSTILERCGDGGNSFTKSAMHFRNALPVNIIEVAKSLSPSCHVSQYSNLFNK